MGGCYFKVNKLWQRYVEILNATGKKVPDAVETTGTEKLSSQILI